MSICRMFLFRSVICIYILVKEKFYSYANNYFKLMELSLAWVSSEYKPLVGANS